MANALRQTQPTILGAGPGHNSPKVSLGLSEFKRVSKIMKIDAGIDLPDEKVNLVHARLQKRLRQLGLSSFKDYCDLVESADGGQERKFMRNALTTNLTRFFREPHHFKHLIQESLPPLIAKAKSGERIRIWSAGCSTGEEAYSIASVVHTLCPEIAGLDFKILASDIDNNVIRTGHLGKYKKSEVMKLPVKVREKYFTACEKDLNTLIVKEHLRSLVAFRHLNLNAKHWPMRGKFDIIFCRNTVIYFDEATQVDLWMKFKNQMQPGGFLYIGHSEKLSGPAEAAFRKPSITVYQLENT
jgi:chemotaxis protein methyltransferase CheR